MPEIMRSRLPRFLAAIAVLIGCLQTLGMKPAVVEDRHVPFVPMSSGIEPGRIDLRVATVDMAPTLAHLVGVPFPDDLDGRPLVR